jgi:hypothetical protein
VTPLGSVSPSAVWTWTLPVVAPTAHAPMNAKSADFMVVERRETTTVGAVGLGNRSPNPQVTGL